jgi:hypothetical protein
MRANKRESNNETKRRLLDLAIYVSAGLAVVGFVFFWAESGHDDLPTKWIGLAGSTALLFGYPIYWARRQHKTTRFWLSWLGFLFVHFAIAIVILRPIPRLPLILFIPTTMGELAVINPILGKQLRPMASDTAEPLRSTRSS